MERTVVWMQKSADGSVCKLWHYCTQSVLSQTMKGQRSIKNELQYKVKQDLISLRRKFIVIFL